MNIVIQKHKYRILLKTFLILQIFLFWDIQVKDSTAAQTPSASYYNRIISMSPGVTETLFALGLGDKVVGITRYCTYPPETEEITKVGGFYDPSYETIVSLKPDLVILLTSHKTIEKNLKKLGLKILIVKNNKIEDILDSITAIGNFCGVEKKAKELLENIKKRIRTIKSITAPLSKPKVLLSVDRNTGTQLFNEVYVAGKNIFYDKLITLAGGKNVCNTRNIRYPILSGEGIIRLNPDVIIDIVPDYKEKGLEIKNIIDEWNRFPSVEAVKNKRVYVFGNHYTAIPGPRFILTLEALAKTIHPEVQWKQQ